MTILANTTPLKTQMVISQSMIEWDMVTETQTLEKDGIVSISIYLYISEVDIRPLPHMRWISL